MANFSLGEAVLGTVMDLAGLRKGMGQAEGESKSLWGKIGAIGEKALGTLTGNIATKGFDALLGAVQSVGDTLLNEAPRVEGLRTSFDNLAESAGFSGDAIMDSLRDAAKGMVTDVSLMESFNKSMLLVGEGMATKLPKLLEIAQASAAATGEDVGFLLDSLVTGIGRGSPMILDNLGLTINLSEAYESYAKTLGITTEEMTKAQQQEALLNAVVAAGDGFIARLGDNTGGTAQTMAQLKTTLENTKMELATALLPALMSLLPVITQLAQQYGPMLIDFATQAGQWLGQNLPVALQTLSTWWQATWPQVQSTLAAVWAVLQPVLSQVVAWIGTNLPVALAALQAWWPQVQSGASQIGTVMTTVVIPAIQQLATWFTGTLIPALQQVWAYFNNNILPTYNIIAGVTLTVLGAAVETLASIWNTLLYPAILIVGGYIESTVMPLLSALGDLIGAVLNVALTAMAGIWENVIAPAVDKAATAFNTKIKPALESVANVVLPALQGALDGVGNTIGTVIGWIESMAEKLKSLSLPDWMTPGSPTPWEIGLRGIADALGDVSNAQLPQLGAGMGGLPTPALAGAGAMAGGGEISINFNGNMTLDNPQRVRELAEEISRILGEQLQARRI